jgi:signal transduction histidine kinase
MRRSKSEYRNCDVNVLLDSLIKFLEKEGSGKGVSFLKIFEQNLPDVKIEESRLRQIMLNIVRNSFEAMPKGGQIRIITKKGRDDVEVIVEDTGMGISRENLKRIFDTFFTTKDIGTGLGLYIARDMVIDAGGGISCESKVNEGTKVKIKLPAAV